MEIGPLYEAYVAGDARAILRLVREDETVLDQKFGFSSNTALHLATELGDVRLAAEILRLRPGLVSATNANSETPVYQACSRGELPVLKLLLAADPEAVHQPNGQGQNPLQVACCHGHLDVVIHLLENPRVLYVDQGNRRTALHAAAAEGQTDVVVGLLKVSRSLAHCGDVEGRLPIHLAASSDRVEIMKEFLKVDPSLCSERDGEGRTPVHLAVMNGHVSVLEAMLSVRRPLSSSPMSNELAAEERPADADLFREGIWNTQNTIVVVATLIASVTYSAGINPPHGKSSAWGSEVAFKVFVITNNVALFSSLAIVLVLISVIPYKYRPLRPLLKLSHMGLWAAVMLMQAAYLAATWMAVETKWVVLVAMASAIWLLEVIGIIGLVALKILLWLKRGVPILKWGWGAGADRRG